jgi:hypothetical protein
MAARMVSVQYWELNEGQLRDYCSGQLRDLPLNCDGQYGEYWSVGY